ncbi:MAG TPA: DUF1127 domain-containing protein [Geminicoccaceae bacterium]|nr:DUF1127 domain-containing protein [Geminicoccaceae bacterium]
MNALTPIIAGVLRVSSLLAVWSERVEMRRRLAAIPEHLLADVGLERAQVTREVGRPFWRPFGECLAAGGPSLRPAASSGVPLPTVLRPVARLAAATFPTLS